MSLRTRALSTLAATGALVAGVALVADGRAGATPAELPQGASLAEVRAATARYHDVDVALADGFVPVGGCTAEPGLGGMGVHYMHPGRVADPAIVATEPELLLYEPLPNGALRLVGVEWFAVDDDQDLTTDHDRPSVMGIPFDGPMPGHEPGMPIHYDLHAWVWKHNPDGMFAPWNPTVRCDG